VCVVKYISIRYLEGVKGYFFRCFEPRFKRRIIHETKMTYKPRVSECEFRCSLIVVIDDINCPIGRLGYQV